MKIDDVYFSTVVNGDVTISELYRSVVDKWNFDVRTWKDLQVEEKWVKQIPQFWGKKCWTSAIMSDIPVRMREACFIMVGRMYYLREERLKYGLVRLDKKGYADTLSELVKLNEIMCTIFKCKVSEEDLRTFRKNDKGYKYYKERGSKKKE